MTEILGSLKFIKFAAWVEVSIRGFKVEIGACAHSLCLSSASDSRTKSDPPELWNYNSLEDRGSMGSASIWSGQ